jgi:hypothetical protein
VKIKTLATEARIIRHEEQRALSAGRKGKSLDRGDYAPHYRSYEGLHEHRTKAVRDCARHNILAYGFLRDVPYGKMEVTSKREPDWQEVKRHARAFCPDRSWSKPWPDEWNARWENWLTAALAFRKVHQAAA